MVVSVAGSVSGCCEVCEFPLYGSDLDLPREHKDAGLQASAYPYGLGMSALIEPATTEALRTTQRFGGLLHRFAVFLARLRYTGAHKQVRSSLIQLRDTPCPRTPAPTAVIAVFATSRNPRHPCLRLRCQPR